MPQNKQILHREIDIFIIVKYRIQLAQSNFVGVKILLS